MGRSGVVGVRLLACGVAVEVGGRTAKTPLTPTDPNRRTAQQGV